tara:strand:+ start:3533 stop:3976 length:444 start_codon:yes stop_codon:yes gene_type:complete
MFLTEDLLKRMIQEINDDYLTQVPSTADTVNHPPSDAEIAMDALTDELVDIQLDIQEGVSFMGKAMDYEEFLSIVGNYVISYENRRGGTPNKFLRKDLKRGIREALADVPQIIADSVAEVLEDYIEDDRYGGYGMSDSPEVTGDYEL